MSFPVNMPMARAYAEAGMTATCTITGADAGEPVWDAGTGTYTHPERSVVYSGACRVKPATTQGRSVDAGEAELLPSMFRVSIPFAAAGSADVRQGMQLVVDASADAALIGRRFEIRFTPDMGEHITARRLLCEEMS